MSGELNETSRALLKAVVELGGSCDDAAVSEATGLPKEVVIAGLCALGSDYLQVKPRLDSRGAIAAVDVLGVENAND